MTKRYSTGGSGTSSDEGCIHLCKGGMDEYITMRQKKAKNINNVNKKYDAIKRNCT